MPRFASAALKMQALICSYQLHRGFSTKTGYFASQAPIVRYLGFVQYGPVETRCFGEVCELNIPKP